MKKIKYEKPEIMEIGQLSEWILGASCSPTGETPSSTSSCETSGVKPSTTSTCSPSGSGPSSNV